MAGERPEGRTARDGPPRGGAGYPAVQRRAAEPHAARPLAERLRARQAAARRARYPAAGRLSALFPGPHPALGCGERGRGADAPSGQPAGGPSGQRRAAQFAAGHAAGAAGRPEPALQPPGAHRAPVSGAVRPGGDGAHSADRQRGPADRAAGQSTARQCRCAAGGAARCAGASVAAGLPDGLWPCGADGCLPRGTRVCAGRGGSSGRGRFRHRAGYARA